MKGIIARYAEATATLREARRAARAARNEAASDPKAQHGAAPPDSSPSAVVKQSQDEKETLDPTSGAVFDEE